jgi:hypothetical protein
MSVVWAGLLTGEEVGEDEGEEERMLSVCFDTLQISVTNILSGWFEKKNKNKGRRRRRKKSTKKAMPAAASIKKPSFRSKVICPGDSDNKGKSEPLEMNSVTKKE